MEDEESILKTQLEECEDFGERQTLRKKLREIRKKKFEEEIRVAEEKLSSGVSCLGGSRDRREAYRSSENKVRS